MGQLTLAQIIVGLATLGVALGVGLVLPPIFLRMVVRSWEERFKRIEGKIDRLQPEHVLKIEGFDPERLAQHYQKVHNLSSRVTENGLRLETNTRRLEDHEGRLRHLERSEKPERAGRSDKPKLP